jgi:hypothetical protein
MASEMVTMAGSPSGMAPTARAMAKIRVSRRASPSGQAGGCGPQHANAQDDRGDGDDGQRDGLADGGQGPGQGCLQGGRLLEQGGDASELGPSSGCDHQPGGGPVGHQGPAEGHRGTVADGGVRGHGADRLLHGHGLTGQGRLVDAQPLDRREPQVRRDQVPRGQQHQVPWDQVGDRYTVPPPIPHARWRTRAPCRAGPRWPGSRGTPGRSR